MPFDLEAEIARRLNVSRDAVGPVLDAVIERIRQQVSHYGYARLAGLGTFRGQNGQIAFEPDVVLADEVNARFSGLEDVRVEAVGQEEEEDEEVLYGDSPGDDYERTDAGTEDEESSEDVDDVEEASSYVSPPFPPAETPSFEEEPEPGDAVPEASHEPFPWDEATEPVADDAPGVSWAETSDEPIDERTAADSEQAWVDDAELDDVDAEERSEAAEPVDADEPDETRFRSDADEIGEATESGDAGELEDERFQDEEDEADEAETWFAQPDELHPLGPVADAPFEEADYSVLDEQRAAGSEFDEDEDAYGDLEEEFDSGHEYQAEGAFDGGAAAGGGPESENVDDFDDDFARHADDEGRSVDWNTLDEQPEVEDYADDEEGIPAGGAAFGGAGQMEREPSHEKAPDRHARPHERIRQHPPRRHGAAHATGGGAAGGNRNAIWIGVGVLVVVAIAAVAYFVITPDGPDDEPFMTEETEAPIDTAASAVPSAADTTAAAAEPSVAEEESTPLRSSEGIDQSAGGFTIIVYSETSESGAAGVAAPYRDRGFRTSVLEYEESGTTRYRVGVGQFSTLQEASDARDRLAGSDLPEDAWVRRVQ